MTTGYKVAIIPGNGCSEVFKANWYGWLHKRLEQNGIFCELRSMPDPEVARESIWIPFMREELKCDEQTIIVGHSSGAEAAMRFAQKYKVGGIVLVSACVTDLGIENERQSGYYNRPWEWTKIKENTKFVAQFGSQDDPFIPWSEQNEVADNLNAELFSFQDRGHFMSSTFPELLKLLILKVKECEEGM